MENIEQQVDTITNKNDGYETYSYSADITKVMSILVRSIYTDKDIFIRELISNSSDAINKVCLINPQYTLNNTIKIWYSKDSKQITIQDTGVGITKKELIEKIGSIGTSGTKQFMENLAQSKDKLIGQFGVGFYSVYLVADYIQVITKPVHEPNKIYEWVSSSESSYSIRELELLPVTKGRETEDREFERGTRIILTLKADCEKYLEQDELIKIIKTYSSYIEHTILFEKTENKKGDDKKYLRDENGNYIEEIIWEKMNWLPLWSRPKNEITHQEYEDFYLHNIQDNLDQHIKEPPLIYKHFKMESNSINFTALLYIPAKAPFNLFEPSKRGQSIKLYTKNVLITAEHKDLYPNWMEFIKGIVETSDIELNVSRQTVQNTNKLKIIRNQLIKKVIEMIEELTSNTIKFKQFQKEFACSLKNGINEEYTRETHNESERNIGNTYGKRLMKLLRFHTSQSRFVGFDEYVNNMKPTQKGIYYLAGDKKEALRMSPFMDKITQMGMEVLFFEEAIDDYIKGFLTEYKFDESGEGYVVGAHDANVDRFKKPDMNDLNTKVFVDIAREDLLLESTIDENEMKKGQELCDKLLHLYRTIRWKQLGIEGDHQDPENPENKEKNKKYNPDEFVEPKRDDVVLRLFEVKLDDKFNSVPAIIVNHVKLTAQLEKLLKNAAASKRTEQYKGVFDRKDMLISFSNNITKHLYQKLCVENTPYDDPDLIDKALTIYTMAMIAGGYEPDNAFRFVRKVNELMTITF